MWQEYGRNHNILVGKTPLGRPKCRWEDNIRMYLREMWWEVVDWINLDRDRDE